MKDDDLPHNIVFKEGQTIPFKYIDRYMPMSLSLVFGSQPMIIVVFFIIVIKESSLQMIIVVFFIIIIKESSQQMIIVVFFIILKDLLLSEIQLTHHILWVT